MGVDRPLFDESWHRVAALRPRLRADARVSRVPARRGRVWRIIEDPLSGRSLRANEAAWAFVGRLDGSRAVREAWQQAGAAAGDGAPTQGEAIQLLARLSEAGLLAGDAPADARGVLRRRALRRAREAWGWPQLALFPRFKLIDPDRFLRVTQPMVAWLFSPIGAALWVLLIAVGAAHVVGRWNELGREFGAVLASANLPQLALAFAGIKVLHEFAHAFACKVLLRREGREGTVPAMGVMFLLGMPAPYVDASSAWGLRSRGARALVGAAGMVLELAVASIAAIVWARAAPDSGLRAISANVMLLASVGTLLVNLNPLMRFDGYFILCDLLDQPNLAPRAQAEVMAFLKRRVWGIRKATGPAESARERAWLMIYAGASWAYRVGLCAAMVLFMAGQQFLLAGAIAGAMLVIWVLVPMVKFVSEAGSAPEYSQRRGRVFASTAAALVALSAACFVLPLPSRATMHARVKPDPPRAVAELGAVPMEGIRAGSVAWARRVSDPARAIAVTLELVDAEAGEAIFTLPPEAGAWRAGERVVVRAALPSRTLAQRASRAIARASERHEGLIP